MATPLAPAAVNFGTCWGTPNGQDLSSPSYMASGNLCVAEAILRRWSTSPGQLIDDPDYGRNVYDLLSADLSDDEIAYEQQQLAAEATKDERVRRATVTLTFQVDGTLRIEATITTAAGPFKFVVNVSQVTTQLLMVAA